MSNIVSTIIFCGRNFDKTDNGDIGRAPVAVGQFRNVVNGVTAYDNAIGKTAKTAVNAFDKVAKADKLVDYAGKGVRFLSKNINPLICVSSGIQILNSDDKERTAMVQATALGGMFIGEGTMKKYFPKSKEMKGYEKASKVVERIAEKIHCKGSALSALLKGVAFVIGSCLSYDIGECLGKATANSVLGEENVSKNRKALKQMKSQMQGKKSKIEHKA